MKPPHLVPPSVLSLLSRIDQIESLFKTLVDATQLTQDATLSETCPDIWPSDLSLFKWIVEHGVMKSAKFKPPNGYKILGFLTLLSFLQEEQREKSWQEQRDEMNGLFKTMPPEAHE